MPENDPNARVSPGVAAIQRARGMFNRAGGAVRDFAARTFTGVRNAVPGTSGFDVRQTIDAIPGIPGDWFDSQTRRWQNPITGTDWNFGRPTPGQPLMAGQVPRRDAAGAPPPQPGGAPAMPNYSDPNAVGPPEHLAGRTPMPRPVDPTAGRQGTAGRHGTTVATGQNAVNFARGIGHANSGLGASSYGRDRMNQTNREG